MRSRISKITNLTNAISNPARGDCIFLDLDNTLWLTDIKRYKGKLSLIEPEIISAIKMLRERGIKVIGLTARKSKHTDETLKQLQEVSVQLDEVIHAEDQDADVPGNKAEPYKWQALLDYAASHQNEIKSGELKRIFVFDDIIEQLEKIEKNCPDIGVPVFLKHFTMPEYLATVDQVGSFPETLEDYCQYKELNGGTRSVFKIKNPVTQQELVLKHGAHEDAGKLEILGNAVYQVLGVKVPAMRIYKYIAKDLAKALKLERQHGRFKVCEFISEASNIGSEERARLVRQDARKHYLAHVLMGNIDIAKEDNFIVDDQHNVYVIDAGANFQFRSKGKPRKEDPSFASEIDSLRDPSINRTGAQWFGDLSDAELSVQLDSIQAKVSEVESLVWKLSLQLQIPDDLRDQFLQNLSERLDVLKTRLQRKPQHYAKTDKKPHKDKTSAGVLTYKIVDGKVYVLLSKRVRHEWWDNFGGKSNSSDESLAATAAREVAEESKQQINYTTRELLQSPCHDIVTGEGKSQHLYRMYICPYPQIDLTRLKDDEHTDNAWVSLNDLLAAVKAGETVELEQQKTGTVQSEGKTIPIYPPFFTMLKQKSVLDNLERLNSGEEMQHTVTLSHADGIDEPQDMTPPLITPHQKRNELAENHLKKVGVLREFKKSKHFAKQTDDNEPPPVDLSQTELYLKACLGNAYQEGNLQGNIEAFVSCYYSARSEEERTRLVAESVKLVAKEKQYGSEYFYIYHGVNNIVAFVYDVYAALYSTLHVSENWQALRDDNPYLRRFEDITQLIAHYSDNGKKKIHNNDKNYNDCVIAGNVFLFGCHAVSSSSSIHYMLDNYINRKIDLKTLLDNIFKPFNITEEEIRRLISVYDQYEKIQGGRLYQIAMRHNDASRMSYAAKSGGRVFEFQGVFDLVDIMHQLISDLEKLPENRGYMSELQARAMMPPYLQFQTMVVHWKQLPDEQQHEYLATLEQAVNSMVYKRLIHSSPGIQGARGGALIAAAPHVLRANDLTCLELSPERAVVNAIKANDAVAVRELIRQFPDLLQKTVYLPRNCIKGFSSHQQKSVSVWRLILDDTQLPLDLVIDFSQANCLDLLPDITSYSEFKKVLLRIPEKHRAGLVHKYRIFVLEKPSHVCKTLNLIPVDHRLAVVKGCPRDTLGSLGGIAGSLLPEQRLPFVMDYITNSQGTLEDLEYVLPLISTEAERVAAVKKHIALIHNNSDLEKILKLLAVESRCDVTDAVLSGKDFRDYKYNFESILELLPQASQFEYAIKYCSCFDSYDLFKILKILPEGSARLQYATHMLVAIRQSRWTDNQGQIIKLLEPEDRLPFVNLLGEVFDTSSYITILKALKPVDRLAFAINHQKHCIDNPCGFIDTLNALGADAYQFLTAYQGEIKNGLYVSLKKYIPAYELYAFMSTRIHDEESLMFTLTLAQSSLVFGLVTQYHHLIGRKSSHISEIVVLLPKEHRLEFAMQHTDVIGDRELRTIAKTLDSENVLTFVTACIRDMATLVAALKELPAQQRLEVARKFRSCITDSRELKYVIDLLNKEKQEGLIFASESIDHIPHPAIGFDSLIRSFSKADGTAIVRQVKQNCAVLFEAIIDYLGEPDGLDFGFSNMQNEANLEFMLKKIPIESRLAAARQHQSLITTCKGLRVTALLPAESRFAFATSLQHLLKEGDDLEELLKCLENPAERLEFATENKHKITSGWQLSCIVTTLKLPEDKALEFKKSCVNSESIFHDLVSDLPKAEAFLFAMQYKHMVSAGNTISWVLMHIENEKHREFLYAIDGQMQDNNYIYSISGHLPKDEQLPYILRNLKDGFGIGTAVHLLPENEIESFINEHSHLISSGRQLAFIMESLPRGMRQGFMKNQLDKIVDCGSLREFADELTFGELLQFVLSHQEIMKSDEDVAKVVGCLISKNINIDVAQVYQLMISNLERIYKPSKLSYEAFSFVTNHIKDFYVSERDDRGYMLRMFSMFNMRNPLRGHDDRRNEFERFLYNLHEIAKKSLSHDDGFSRYNFNNMDSVFRRLFHK